MTSEVLVVDRRDKCYAFFVDGEQRGNWIGYVGEDEPERVASENEIILQEKQP